MLEDQLRQKIQTVLQLLAKDELASISLVVLGKKGQPISHRDVISDLNVAAHHACLTRLHAEEASAFYAGMFDKLEERAAMRAEMEAERRAAQSPSAASEGISIGHDGVKIGGAVKAGMINGEPIDPQAPSP